MVAEGSRGGGAHAVSDGIARVVAAPVILAGTIALVVVYGPHHDLRHNAGALLLWAFLSGGTLDRYARRRPTRARGFFAACGAHLGAMLRLALAVVLLLAAVHLVIGRDFASDRVHMAAFVAALGLAMLLTIAQVRVAVEDRRSALGALLAAARFAGRNPAVIVMFVLFAVAFLGIMLVSERVPAAEVGGIRAWTAVHLCVAAECFVLLAWYAAATSLFQSRLAHVGYTAAPPLQWPESPAAEAIANHR